MFKPFLLLQLFIGITTATGLAQTYTHVYYMNESFASVKKEAAVFECKGYQDSLGFKLDCFTIGNNALALSCYFTDESLTTLQGSYKQYHPAQLLQTSGVYHNNVKAGVWEEWDEDGYKTDSTLYEDGQRLQYIHYSYFNDRKQNKTLLYSIEEKDSLAGTFNKVYLSDSGTVVSKAHFVGNRGLFEHIEDGKFIRDSVFSREETEAEYSGGNAAWLRYVQRELINFNPALEGAPDGKWQVIVRFVVGIDGSVSEIIPETNFGFKMEKVAVDMIAKSSKWAPAVRFGIPVKAYRRQPVTFVVSTQ